MYIIPEKAVSNHGTRVKCKTLITNEAARFVWKGVFQWLERSMKKSDWYLL